MKKTVIFIVAIILVAVTAAAVIFVPELVHRCDDCNKVYFGTGYKPNLLNEIFTDEMNRVCEECATKQHSLSGLFGKEVDEYKYDLFE